MAALRIDVDAPALNPLIARLDVTSAYVQLETQRAVSRALSVIEFEVKDRTPIRSGRLWSSIRSHQMAVLEGRVSTNVYYGPWVEAGRGPVVARQARALRIPTRTGYIFRKHAGPAAGRHMFREGLLAAIPAIRLIFSESAHAVTRFIAGK